MSGKSEDKPNGSIFGGMILSGGNGNIKVWWQEYLMTKTDGSQQSSIFKTNQMDQQTDQKLFIVKYNRIIPLLFIPRQMGELQRRLNGRRRLDQLSGRTSWLVVPCNLSFSSQCLNDKWIQSAIVFVIEARGDPAPLQLENTRRPWADILSSSLPPLGPSLLAVPKQWVMEEKGLTWLSIAGSKSHFSAPLSQGRSSFHV